MFDHLPPLSPQQIVEQGRHTAPVVVVGGAPLVSDSSLRPPAIPWPTSPGHAENTDPNNRSISCIVSLVVVARMFGRRATRTRGPETETTTPVTNTQGTSVQYIIFG